MYGHHDTHSGILVLPLDLDALDDTSQWSGDILEACGIRWDAADIARFLSMCTWEQDEQGDLHLIWNGAKSRGRGNTAWYGSFWVQGKSIRAHKFYGVAVLGLRPKPGIHHLDHQCPNSLCVSCVQKEVEAINLKLRWIRVQVGLDEDKVRGAVVDYLVEQTEEWFDPYDPADFSHWLTEDNRWRFDPMHPLNYPSFCDDLWRQQSFTFPPGPTNG